VCSTPGVAQSLELTFKVQKGDSFDYLINKYYSFGKNSSLVPEKAENGSIIFINKTAGIIFSIEIVNLGTEQYAGKAVVKTSYGSLTIQNQLTDLIVPTIDKQQYWEEQVRINNELVLTGDIVIKRSYDANFFLISTLDIQSHMESYTQTEMYWKTGIIKTYYSNITMYNGTLAREVEYQLIKATISEIRADMLGIVGVLSFIGVIILIRIGKGFINLAYRKKIK
jgi:hypothetical protein